MAVPKKKMSKSRRNSRKSNWKKKVLKKVLFALSLGKSFEANTNVNFSFGDKLPQ
jgi:large subunit ribosomal protein L32|uniref:Large ribosomal subunit protein bL32c n=2 Tax=Euglena gracilis TaxID=3039 RepID=RK32_EUGGR|nr:ribosomal protein L32 [Euglena gracilis]P31558.2 RecName: Full=Large ribosomal subunit protein bL32c; AltName: Full=50S ribosomal protein L32, chloroplastic [Euglena gracilis]AKL82390.1 ribosomal protein L32 [Euglena gracilis var. bacillaris]CAA50122.1 50S ribosomal protein L32 [Euglena gracilis]